MEVQESPMRRPDSERRPPADPPRAFLRMVDQPGYGLLLLGLAAMLILGVIILRDFGTSADEGANATWGERFLKAYETGGLTRQDLNTSMAPSISCCSRSPPSSSGS
jgi:hypothetical protein